MAKILGVGPGVFVVCFFMYAPPQDAGRLRVDDDPHVWGNDLMVVHGSLPSFVARSDASLSMRQRGQSETYVRVIQSHAVAVGDTLARL
jgi:hypothetical protein